MTLVTDTWTDPGADGTLAPDTGSITLQTVVAAANQTTDPRMVTTKPITCFLDEEGRTVFEVVDSFDPGWALDGPMPYKVTRNLGSGRRVYAVIITGTETHLRDLEPIEDVDVAPYPVPGDKGDQGEVAVHSTVTGSPGSPALVEDLDPSIHKALLKFTIPEGVKGDQGEVEVGTTTTLDAGSAATVTDSDPSPNRAVLDFGIPQGTLVEVDSTATGDAGTPAVVEDVDPSPNRAALKFTIPQGTEVQVGTTTTGAPGTQASVTDRDPSPNRTILDFTVPRGDKGDQGEVAVVPDAVTGAPGTQVIVEDLDPSPHKALIKFTIPEGLPGAAATVDAGTTLTGAPGTPAQVINAGSTSAAVFDFVVPEGQPGQQGPPGVSAAATYSYRISAGSDADVAPAAGYITVESTGGQSRRLAISKTDATGASRAVGVILPGSQITIVYDSDAVAPADSIAQYVVAQVVSDQGTWVKVETIRTQLFGSPAVPPGGALVGVVMTLGAGDYYIASGLLTTKGDLVARDATTAVRVPLGADAAVLEVDSAAAAGVKWGAAKADKASIGNLLTDNVATGTDLLGDTSGFTAVNATLTSDSTQYAQGSRSLKLVCSGSVANWGVVMSGTTTSGTIPVTPGEMYTALMSYHSGGMTNSPVLHFNIYWYKSDGTAAASTPSNTLMSPVAAWQSVVSTAVAPADAAFANVRVRRNSGTNIGDVLYIDRLSFHKGAAGNWAMPGTPITGLQSSMEQVTLWADLPATGNWLGRQIAITSVPGKVAVWKGSAWYVDPVTNAVLGP